MRAYWYSSSSSENSITRRVEPLGMLAASPYFTFTSNKSPLSLRNKVVICASVTRIVKTSPSFMVTVSVSSLSNGCTLIKAQSPDWTTVLLIPSICASVSSVLYSQSSPIASFSSPTVVSVSTFSTCTNSGLLNITDSTSSTNFFEVSLAVTSSMPLVICSSILASFSSEFVSPMIPRTSTRSVKLTNPPPGRLNWYILPSTSYSKSTVYTIAYTEKAPASNVRVSKSFFTLFSVVICFSVSTIVAMGDSLSLFSSVPTPVSEVSESSTVSGLDSAFFSSESFKLFSSAASVVSAEI